MISVIIACALLTTATLFFIFRPLLIGSGSPSLADLQSSTSLLKRLLRRKETVYENIKDLDFEYKMGKLSDDDYHRLRDEYAREAYVVMQEIEKVQPEHLQKTGQPQVVAVLKPGKKSRK
jgi:hypothetical protein